MQPLLSPALCAYALARFAHLQAVQNALRSEQPDHASPTNDVLARLLFPVYLTLHHTFDTALAIPSGVHTRWSQLDPLPCPTPVRPANLPDLQPNQSLILIALDGPNPGTHQPAHPSACLPVILTLTPTHLILSG